MGKPNAGQKKNRTSKRNRQTKQFLIFDENARRDYLTGFRKRKDERRRRAAEQLIQDMKDEKRRLKQQVRDMMKSRVDNQPSVPEVEHLLDPEEGPDQDPQQVFELPSHTVTVTDISEIDLSGKDGLWLGQNTFNEKEEDGRNDEQSPEKTDQSEGRKTDPKEVKRLKRKMAKIGQSNVKKLLQSKKKKKSRRKKSAPRKNRTKK